MNPLRILSERKGELISCSETADRKAGESTVENLIQGIRDRGTLTHCIENIFSLCGLSLIIISQAKRAHSDTSILP